MTVRLRGLARTDLEALPQGLREWFITADALLRSLQRAKDGMNGLPASSATTVDLLREDFNAALEAFRA